MDLYRVTARRTVLGFDPGTEFEADLDPVQEGRLLAGGHLVKLADGETTWNGQPFEPELRDVVVDIDEHEELEDTARDDLERQGGRVEELPS